MKLYSLKVIQKSRRASLLVLTLLVIACTKPISSTISPNGAMNILGPVPLSLTNTVPAGWITQGSPAPGQLSVVKLDGIPALKVVNGQESLMTAKPSQASLLATPYLSWAWYMDSQGDGQHPVRLFVGFDTDNQKTGAWAPRFLGLSEMLPYHDRIISFNWGDSALQRGAIATTNSTDKLRSTANYTVRGGQENSELWWFETVDLYEIYRRAWPSDNVERTQVTFIGIATAPGNTPTVGYISGIRLSR